jgi:hypothetical protein
MSQMQAFAKQRGEQGSSAMLNALAAQFAGESFQPVQAQFLKKASAAQDPMKLGSGLITPEGQYIKDPEVAQNRKAEFLLRQAQAYETLAQNAQSSQERLEAQRAQNEINNQLRLMGLGIQQQGLALRQAAAGTGNFKVADSLRNEYSKRSEKVREGTSYAQSVATLLADPTIANDPTKQVSLIFSFGKMLDPDSVVRESEYALISNARGLGDQLQQMVPRIQTGARLSPQQLQSMASIAQTLLQGSQTRLQDLDNYYVDLAKRRKVDPQDVLPTFRGSGQAQPGGAAPAGADPADPLGIRRK